ncbi:imelysin family protein [Membranicola marinus]|uniref:Imelysin family protein n=1 Tax=Membranihabitans marinus TaxID=1227546 RepID=A0A953L6V9_9BACT|nr:imelysin family protein [Membranihabitans marinus]MBY5958077.1 imelysin family protein [Membranihabitans marinus]
MNATNLFRISRFSIIGILTLLILPGCNDSPGIRNQCSVDYDQEALFSAILRHQITPGYENLQSQLDQLKNDFDALQSDPDLANLDRLETTFADAYQAWKRVEIFHFGPAEELQAQSYFNLFPLDVLTVQNQLSSGFDSENSTQFDKGLPVLDYFIFHKTNPQDRLNYLLQSDVRAYFTAALDKMRSVANQVTEAYGGDYGDQFTTMTGTAAGSSLSLLINALSKFFEDNRRNQLGIPSGALTLDIPNPDKTEAYFSGISLNLLNKGVETAQMLYEGKTNSPGIKDYLEALEDEVDGEKIADQISTQFNKINQAIPPLENPLSKAVLDDKNDIAALYREMSSQVINLKTDLPSRLCISITYVDNPSDTD